MDNKGEIIEKNNVYYIKWSDLHQFGVGWHYMETKIKDNNIKGYKIGDIVDFEHIGNEFNKDFTPKFLVNVL